MQTHWVYRTYTNIRNIHKHRCKFALDVNMMDTSMLLSETSQICHWDCAGKKAISATRKACRCAVAKEIKAAPDISAF
jgi:hypothetical protein